MTPTVERMDEQARAILRQNDRGGYTIPTAGLYPYQWNWDSVFVALGFMEFDEPRAWAELETLFQAQWPNGMVPHIVFRHDDPDYFPGPSVWGTDALDLPMPTSGISQPPVAATAIHWMVDAARDKQAALSKARALLPKLNAWHQWWVEARDPDRLGVVAMSHPWESGRDNLPDWDAPGDAIDVRAIGDYTRRDTSHIDTAMRPKKKDYDRYLALVQFGKSKNWDPAAIAAESPFWVADVGVSAILLRADRDLLALAERLTPGDRMISQARARIARLEAGFDRLWDPSQGAFCNKDLRTEAFAPAATAATLLCFYAGVGTPVQRTRVIEMATGWAEKVRYMCPSFDPTSDLFDPLRYWRGPTWAIFNFMIGVGLWEAGETALAGRIKRDTQALMEAHGFAEYYSAVDGTSAGGDAFSWTAAVWLSWISPSLKEHKKTG